MYKKKKKKKRKKKQANKPKNSKIFFLQMNQNEYFRNFSFSKNIK